MVWYSHLAASIFYVRNQWLLWRDCTGTKAVKCRCEKYQDLIFWLIFFEGTNIIFHCIYEEVPRVGKVGWRAVRPIWALRWDIFTDRYGAVLQLCYFCPVCVRLSCASVY